MSDIENSRRASTPAATGLLRPILRALPFAALVGVFFVLPSASDVESAANTRTLKLYFTHTKERADITFKRNGRYDAAGLKKINHILRDWRRNESTKMDPKLIDLLWEVHRESRAREPIHVVSGYRSPVTNAALRKRSRGVAKNSQHTRGKATDFFIPGVPISKIREIGFKKQVGGVGYYPKSGSPFVHLDTGSVRAWPRMTRKQLLALFPNGKTLHLPSDGKPLSGYAEAEKLERAGKLEKLDSRGDVRVASNSRPRRNADSEGGPKSGRGLLARIFTAEENEEEEAAARPDPAPAPAAQQPQSAPAPTAPTQQAAQPPVEIIAPLPSARPRIEPENTPETIPEDQIGSVIVADAATGNDQPAEEIAAPFDLAMPLPRPRDLPSARPADGGLTIAGLPNARPENAAEAATIAQAYAEAANGSDPLAQFIRGGQPLSALGAEANADAVAGLIRRVAMPASMLEPLTNDAPSLMSNVSLTRTGSTHYFRAPDQTDGTSAFGVPAYVVVNGFGTAAAGPSVGRFEGRAIAPVAFQRIGNSFVRAASLQRPRSVN